MDNQKKADIAVDGYTWSEVAAMATDSIVGAICSECGHTASVEPDASRYDCHECGAKGTVTSPLIKLGLI